MKLAILVLSDPLQGGDEALGRVFNASAFAGTSGLAGLRDYSARGYTPIVF